LFEKAKIRSLIKKSLDQVPSYLWDVKPHQISEVAVLACRATQDLWNLESLKNETVSRKAIFSLNFYGASIKQMNLESGKNMPYLSFIAAAESIASASGDMMFHGLVGSMFQKDPPKAPPL
jgi:hypothetical protein